MLDYVVDVPADFKQRFAAVFEPRAMLPDGGNPKKFTFTLPATGLPEDVRVRIGADLLHGGWKPGVREREGQLIVHSSSKERPYLLPGDGSPSDVLNWQILVRTVEDFRFPLDWLMVDRHVRVKVREWEYATPYASGVALSLLAVQVVDLSEGFIRKRINELKMSFEEA